MKQEDLTTIDSRVIFHNLPKSDKLKLEEFRYSGRVEVRCPWWGEDHWEPVTPTLGFLDDSYYRITHQATTFAEWYESKIGVTLEQANRAGVLALLEEAFNFLPNEQGEAVGGDDRVNILLQALRELTMPCTRADYTVSQLDTVVCEIAQTALDEYWHTPNQSPKTMEDQAKSSKPFHTKQIINPTKISPNTAEKKQ